MCLYFRCLRVFFTFALGRHEGAEAIGQGANATSVRRRKAGAADKKDLLMREILTGWEMHPTTWVYLSSLIMITVFFKFGRFWSVRNLDLVGLISFGPGLLLAQRTDPALSQLGFLLLFVTGGFFLVRLLIDPQMVRRPLLEPNLSTGGLTFMGVSLLIFLMTNVVTEKLTVNDLDGPQRLEKMLDREAADTEDPQLAAHGPGYPLLHLLPSMPSRAIIEPLEIPEPQKLDMLSIATARTMAILSHLAVVIGMVLVGHRHFDNIRTGVAAATVYLVLPYSAQMTGRVDHVLPAALMVWALLSYRRPAIAGILMGLAAGAIYYPLFLLPLWLGFYWQRGFWRFGGGALAMIAILVGSLAWTSSDFNSFLSQLRTMFGWTDFQTRDVGGFWDVQWSAFRLTVMTIFAVLSLSMALWPQPKNLGTLMSCSAALMLGTQFWVAKDGGLFMAWYLPLLVLTIFRPNLEDRIALTTLGDGWLLKFKNHRRTLNQAA